MVIQGTGWNRRLSYEQWIPLNRPIVVLQCPVHTHETSYPPLVIYAYYITADELLFLVYYSLPCFGRIKWGNNPDHSPEVRSHLLSTITLTEPERLTKDRFFFFFFQGDSEKQSAI